MGRHKAIKCKITMIVTIPQMLNIFFKGQSAYYDIYHDNQKYGSETYLMIARNIFEALNIQIEFNDTTQFERIEKIVTHGHYHDTRYIIHALEEMFYKPKERNLI
ncbi:MAG: hypothetical protein PHH83_02960 [Patescibacteria group bacterium]|nr:hypothetical protein [Patescibacteria group bacterium]